MQTSIIVSSGVTSTLTSSTTAEYFVSSGGTLLVNGGGIEIGAVISAGGKEIVSNGSVAGDQIYGVLSVFSGAASHLAGEIIESGGIFYEYNSAIVSNTVVSSGGTFILSGNTSGANINTTLVSGGIVELITGKATLGGTLTFSGGDNILFTSATIGAGNGDQAAIVGFGATDIIEIATLQSGASVSLGFSSSGGNEVVTVLSGASTVESFIFSGTAAYNNSDLVISTFTSGTNSGLVDIVSGTPGMTSSGGVTYTSVTTSTSSAYVESAAQVLLVLSGGVVSSASILSSGGLVVNGGSETAAMVALGGTETVSAGSATVDVISGALVVSGGAESSATIAFGGTETVFGGAVSGDVILGGATINGGSVTSEVVSSGGSILINAGATESATTLLAGANETVLGSANGDQIYGVQLVSNGVAVVTSETVYAGGIINNFLKGGIVSATTVLSGGQLNISGNAFAINDTLSGGALLTLQSPKANITGGLTFAGGFNVVEITGVTSPTYGDLAVNSGFSSTDRIDITSTAFTGSALSLTQTVSGGNTVVTVTSGGSAVVETFIFAGTALDGYFTLLSDGNGGEDVAVPPVSVTTSVTTSTSSAYEETITNTLLVLNGGVVSSAQIDNGGFLTVNGGAESAANVLAGGLETISAGSATDDQIYGSAIVSGGSVTNETVFSGGQLSVAAGASVGAVTLSGGGVLDLASPTATVSAPVTFTGGGNTLEAGAIASVGYGDEAVLSGFSSADKVDVTGVALSGATLSFSTDGAGDSVATISGGGASESFLFASPATYNSSSMSLISDGAGGVDLILDATPVVTFTSFGGQTNKATTIVNGTVDTAVDPEAIGTTVTVTEGAQIVGSAVVGANGQWAANVAFLNTNGANVLTATDTDIAGNTGVTSEALTYNVNTAAAEFTPGDLVISISGDGDGSGSYADNAASPVTLEEITTTGTVVSQLVLPQTAYVVNGVTEYAISSEYGSQSEGSLELSGDGHSLVIVGYGVNDQTYNNAPSTVYGGNALAQSTSVPGGPYTLVPRVVADINADGVIDTSTALTNVFNENNPRSVATVDGTAFWLSGQGVKGDTTQGVFYATDGATTATSINDATDTRTAEIYNGQLYVSADTTQGATNISDYGPLPTSATTPVVLTGLSNSVVLTAATANTANTSAIGQSVNLSPENFFFANNNTLYVADSGNPKNGGIGDGGLQKWVYNGSSWNLEYTLSAGLNLVAGTAAYGTSGLIGLAGKVVGNSVELYATSYNLTDIEPTYVYAITDSLSATSGADEQFSTIFTAAPGSNVRGIAFAPTPLGPTISGTVAGQTTISEAPVQAFAGVTIADPNSNALQTLTITVGGAGGTLSGTGLTGGAGGVYSLTGSAAVVTSELDDLSFTASAGQPNTSSTSSLTLSDLSSVNTTPVVDGATTVIDTDPAVAPTISGTVAGQATVSEAAINPFSGVTIGDTNAGASDTLTITVGGAGGVLSGTGLSGGTDGVYTLSGSAALVTSELDGLSFEANAGALNTTSTSTFSLSDQSSEYAMPTVDTTTTVVDTDPALAAPVFEEVSGGGVFSGSGSQYMLNLGTFLPGATSPTVQLGILNSVSGLADLLRGSFTTMAGSSFTLTGFAPFSGLGDGQADTSPTVSLSTADGGTFTATIVLNPTSYDSGGYTLPLGAETLTITGTVLTPVTLKARSDTVDASDVLISAATKTLSPGDVITPGGTDNILDLIGGGTFDLAAPAALTNVFVVNATEGAGGALPNITLRSGLNVDLTLASGAGTGAGAKITGADDASVINLGGGKDTVTLGSARETVNGGTGADTYDIVAATAGATINGGSGTGALEVNGGGSVTLGASITGVQSVRLTSATDLTANGLNLTITGSTGADTIQAGSGTEIIIGGGGADTLIAGTGVDTFRDTAARLIQDTIENFQAGDTIDITYLKATARNAVTATWSNGILTVSEGAVHDHIKLVGNFTGAFQTSSDGGVGTNITYAPAAAAFSQAISTFGARGDAGLASVAQLGDRLLQHGLHAATS